MANIEIRLRQPIRVDPLIRPTLIHKAGFNGNNFLFEGPLAGVPFSGTDLLAQRDFIGLQ